jgi:hypothetical protein
MLRCVFWQAATDVSEVHALCIISVIITPTMVAASTSETSITFYRTIWRNIPEDVFILPLFTRARHNFSLQ